MGVQVGHPDEHQEIYDILNTHYPSETGGMAGSYAATSVDWGEAYVHPTDGSDSYDGLSRSTPKATISAAMGTGAYRIHVGAGTHSISAIDSPVTLLLYPGTHSFSNAPVTSDTPFVLRNVSGENANKRYTSTGGVTVTAPSSVTDFFQVGGSGYNSYGGLVEGIRFDVTKITRSAFYSMNLNHMCVRYCSLNSAGTPVNRKLIYADQQLAAGGYDNSWWRVQGNWTNYAQLLYADSGYGWINRWVVSDNVCDGGYDGNAMDSPFIEFNDRAQGMVVRDNSLEGIQASGVGAIYFVGRNNNCTIANNHFEFILSGSYAVKAPDISSSIIEFNCGATSANGTISINGTAYSTDTNAFDSQSTHILVTGTDNNTA